MTGARRFRSKGSVWIVGLAFLATLAACDSDSATATDEDAGGSPGADVVASEDVPLGCDVSATGDTAEMGARLLISDRERLDPEVPAADLAALVAGNSAFALDLYDVLRTEEGNLFCSPFSISIALAMTYGGALGETAEQMATTLHFTLPGEQLHPAFNALERLLEGRNQPADEDALPFRLNIANSIWGQDGYPFLDSFLDLMAESYGAGLNVLDFARDPELCRGIINDWVADHTEQKILDLIPPGAIDTLTRMVLANAIYFNASWEFPFETEDTVDGAFVSLDESTLTVPMMTQTEGFSYAEGEGYRALNLPYDGREVSMLVVLPDAGRFAEIEDALALVLADVDEGWEYRMVDLTMPRFEATSSFRLRETLQALGMTIPFTSGVADFNAMADTHELFISDVIHKAFVSVDEAGTEAAAATAVIMEGSGMPEHAEFTMNRPFLFLIRDASGALLFLGRVLEP